MKLGTLSGTSRALPPPRPRRLRSLASRLVLLGIAQMLLFAAAAVAIFIAQGPSEPPHPSEQMATIRRLESGNPDAVLEELRAANIEATLYDSERLLIATNVDPPLAIPRRHGGPGRPPDAPPRPTSGARRMPSIVIQVKLTTGEGVLVARGVHEPPLVYLAPVLALASGLVILIFGALFTARWIVRPIDRLSRTARAIGSGDLAARSRLERSDEIGELGHRFDEMAERIAGLLVTEKELLANVAHELRTPLTRIGVALDLAAEGDSDAARASLAEIAVDVSELEQIVDDVLVAMRYEVAGEFPLRRAVVEPASIAGAAAERMSSRHAGRPVTVTVADGLPSIDVDPMLFRRVIDNLLDNAHKYTPDGGSTIEFAVQRTGDRVEFAVRDRGVGISAEDLPRVFVAFFRGDRSRSRETGGVGLGLTLAKRIVEAHGGTITVESKLGAGTTVRVAVPAV